jgi:hypothetical protein
MSAEVPRHRWWRAKHRIETFTNSRWFEFICILAGVLLALACVGGAVKAIQHTDRPGYEWQENAR